MKSDDRVPKRAYNRLLQKEEPNFYTNRQTNKNSFFDLSLHFQTIKEVAIGWTVRGSNPCEGETFRARPNKPCIPPSLLYNGYQVSSQEVKWPGRGVDAHSHLTTRLKVKQGELLPLLLPGPDSKGRLPTGVQLLMLSQLPMICQALSSAVARILTAQSAMAHILTAQQCYGTHPHTLQSPVKYTFLPKP